jgi:hypothetical protein
VRLITFIRAFDRAFMFVKSLELKLAYICFWKYMKCLILLNRTGKIGKCDNLWWQ